MTKALILFVPFSLFLWLGCNSSQTTNDDEVKASEPTEVEEETIPEEAASVPENLYVLDTEQSSIKWHGAKKFTEKKHDGNIQLSNGKFIFEDGIITHGEFVADMSTITNLDVEDPKWNAKLVNHLKSDEFFEVETYPTASFVVTSSKPYEGEGDFTHEITGDMTIKGITKKITFPAKVKNTAEGLIANASFTIDRSQYNVQYGSESFFPNLIKEAKDQIIKNEIDLKINLVATPAG